jgi:hypothetical protein
MRVVSIVVMVMSANLNGSDGRNVHIFLSGKPRMAVEDSLEGARARLNRARCQELFEEFTDQQGLSLAAKLRSTGHTGGEQLASLYFVAADEDRCRADETVAAFTAPGSRVIHICAARFSQWFALKTRDGELLLIHELLHSLGLGENPPRSSDITAKVRARCGD